MDIRILPSNIADMIAAGEVVQRPASVVKELVENAADAGSDRISIIVTDAGRTLIQVVDNGCGMTSDEAVLCFQRHATSKIYCAADLEAIETFGFRGEALASIAAVAEVTLKTRTANSDVAIQVTITDATADVPGRQDIIQTAAPVGSNFAVRNLFYNTPARRKFLKSDEIEMRQIILEFKKMALSLTNVAMSLTSNGKDLFRFPAATSLKFRIKDLFGVSVSDNLLPLKAESSVVAVDGFIGHCSIARKTGANQYFFVNGRYFRCPYLHKAVMKAYENLIPDGHQPTYFIFLTIDPHKMDVNVHPTKTEIKFEDDNILFTVLMAAVREALGRNVCEDALDFDKGQFPEMRQVSDSVGEFRAIAEPPSWDNPSFNPFDDDGFPNQSGWETRPGAGTSSDGTFRPKNDFRAAGDSFFRDGGMSNISDDVISQRDVVVKGRFVVTAVHSGLMVVDTQKAHQRILYEEFLDALSKENPVGQATLFPLEVEVGAENMPVLERNAALLERMGFSLSPFSANTVMVNAVPDGLMDDRMAVSALIYETVTALAGEEGTMAASMYGPLAQKMAVSASRTAQLPLDKNMANALLDKLFACENPEIAPDGHRILRLLKNEDIDKLFK